MSETSPPSPDGPPDAPPPGHGRRQTLHIVAAIALAVAFALAVPVLPEWTNRPAIAVLDVGGEIFLRLLKMVVVPLVVASVMSGILGMGDIRKLGRPGFQTFLYFLGTTLAAVVLGMVLLAIIRPGVGYDQRLVDEARTKGRQELQKKLHSPKSDSEGPAGEGQAGPGAGPTGGPHEGAAPSQGIGDVVKDLVLMLFTDNLLRSMVQFDLLPVIFFSIVFAGLLTTMGDRAGPIVRLVVATNDALLGFVLLLMRFAPAGIFCLVAARFGRAQLDGSLAAVLRQTGWFVAAVLAGLAIHGFLLLPSVLYLFTRRNPWRFVLDMSQSLLTAFSTASSTATIPVTIECAEENAGIRRRAVDLVVPLGATVNMNGTALYEAAAAMFIAQALGMELSLLAQLTIALTATLAAIGAAGIPEAGLVTMVIVLSAVGLPVELIGLVLPVDWFLDRFRTAVNVFGDAVGAAVVEKSFGE